MRATVIRCRYSPWAMRTAHTDCCNRVRQSLMRLHAPLVRGHGQELR
jgi:hypothetical protein